MIKDFKFFQNKERVFTHYLDALDDYHLGGIQPNPPYGISRRHWNLLPDFLKIHPERDILDYLDGWEASRQNNFDNPHHDGGDRARLWNRGWWDNHYRRHGM